MTSRLKKQLNNLGIDPASARVNENFCLIGTPLPPLEKSKDTGEFIPLWKQEVRDEKGRRRLHGAFTGGFSAGYFNTVGSKEGWTPSTFVSSRSDRARQKQARPEDFMDEEDLQDIKDSQTLVHNADEMDFTQRAVAASEDDDIANTLAKSLAPGPNDSSGARILKKMGWKLGQGIGPRLTWKQRRAQDIAAGVPPTTLAEADDEEANKHTYAPRDTPIIITDRKDNSHGLGYKPGMRLDEEERSRGGAVSKGPSISAGFGLGALNDADEDDLDVYDRSIESSRRQAYDIADNIDDDRISIGLKTDRRNRPQTAPGSRQTFANGSLVLADFVLSEKPVTQDQWFPIPDVPPGWKPDPTRIWRQDSNKENDSRLSYETLQQHYRAGTSADERGKILGETPLPSAPRSVFDFISQKDKERIEKMASGKPVESPFVSQPEPTLYVPSVESHIAQAALTGFQPYRNDPDKQTRYMSYLQHQIDSSSPAPTRLPGQQVDVFNKEMEDYKKSATLFKPVTGAMAGRFQSAAVVEHAPQVQEGLHKPSPSTSFLSGPEPEKEKEEEKQLSPKENAAKMGMYGPMTRESTAWMPAKLLCKRFGVKQPEPLVEEDIPAAAPSATPNTDAFISEAKLAITANDESLGDSSEPVRRDLENIGLGDDETQGKDILTYERPGMDIFKAIFASDDEDDGDEKQEDNDEESLVVTESVIVAAPEEPVDPSTFKPTFVPRSKRAKEKDKDKEDKVEKKRKKKDKVLVSFDVEDGGVGLDIQPKADRPKKKRKKDKEKDKGGDEDDMWVEKPPSLEAQNAVAAAPALLEAEGGDLAGGSARGRKRAVDFM